MHILFINLGCLVNGVLASGGGVLASEADERHGNPPQGNQELLLVRDKVGSPQVSLG